MTLEEISLFFLVVVLGLILLGVLSIPCTIFVGAVCDPHSDNYMESGLVGISRVVFSSQFRHIIILLVALGFFEYILDGWEVFKLTFKYAVPTLCALCYFEPILDEWHLYWLATEIRRIKGLFESTDSLREQHEWVNAMKTLELETNWWMERLETSKASLACSETPGTPASTEQSVSLEDELPAMKEQLWIATQKKYKLFLKRPRGSSVREYEVSMKRKAELLEHDSLKSLSDSNRVMHCKMSGGCCSRSCGCCFKARTVYPHSGKPFFAHCTTQCGCCRRERNYIDTYKDEAGNTVEPRGAEVF